MPCPASPKLGVGLGPHVESTWKVASQDTKTPPPQGPPRKHFGLHLREKETHVTQRFTRTNSGSSPELTITNFFFQLPYTLKLSEPKLYPKIQLACVTWDSLVSRSSL